MHPANPTRRQFVAGSLAAPAAFADQEAPPKIIDAWGHVSLPRFLSAEEYLGILDANGAEAGIVGTAATCPDLRELSRAATQYGNRLRAIGMPMGRSPSDRMECMAAQMECGFAGIRLQDQMIAKQPELLDVVGKAGGTPYLEGSAGYRAAAGVLVDFLERYPECVVCGTHFAGPTDPAILEKDAAVARLFRHPRFLVIFSRQGYMEQESLRAWTRALLPVVGWDRVLYGSEFPVALWRNETFRSTQSWVDTAGLNPTAEQRHKFLYENARRHFFAKKRPPARMLDAKWNRMELKTDSPVWLFVKNGVDLPETTHRKILRAYLAKGGDARAGSYRDFVTRVFVDAVDQL